MTEQMKRSGRPHATSRRHALRMIRFAPDPESMPGRPALSNTIRQQIRFCTARDGARLAYATSGKGPPLVKAANWITHLEHDLQSPVWSHLMRDMLESGGYEVATGESTAIALELMKAARFDAIVSDLRMPDMDGAAFWREVSARDPLLARRTLFVTGDTLSPNAREFLKASRCPGLEKPFSKEDLLGGVAGMLAG